MDPARRGLILVTVSAVSFGGVAVLSKIALEAGMSVLSLQAWRWGIAAAAVAPLLSLRRPSLPRRGILVCLALGAVGQFVTSGMYVGSLRHLDAAVGSFLLYLSPVFVAVLAALLLRERLSPRGLIALAVAVGGLALLAFGPGVHASLPGVALALASAITYACTIVASRRVAGSLDALRVAALMMIGAAASFTVASAVDGTLAPPPDARTWAVVMIYATACTALSVVTLYMALPLIGAPRASLVSTLEPVSTAALAFVVLDEVLAAAQVVGAAAILAAVVLVATEVRAAEGHAPAAA